MTTLKAVYKQLNTRKTLKELSEDLERITPRYEEGKLIDVTLHYDDGSIRWIGAKPYNPARKMLVILMLVVMFFTLVSIACDDGPTVVNTADSAINGAGQVQDALNAIDNVNDRVFPDNANSQTICVYTYQNGVTESKPC